MKPLLQATQSWGPKLTAPPGSAFSLAQSVEGSAGPAEAGPGRMPWRKDQRSPCRWGGEKPLSVLGRKGQREVHVYSQIPKHTSLLPRCREETLWGRKEGRKPPGPIQGQRKPTHGSMRTLQGSRVCVVHSSLIKTLVTDTTGPTSGHW